MTSTKRLSRPDQDQKKHVCSVPGVLIVPFREPAIAAMMLAGVLYAVRVRACRYFLL